MAGSLEFYDYTSDNGATFALQLDASNSGAVSNPPATAGGVGLDKSSITPRYLTCQALNPVAGKPPLRRQIVICDATSPEWVDPPATISLAVVGAASLAFTVTGAVGERRTNLQQF